MADELVEQSKSILLKDIGGSITCMNDFVNDGIKKLSKGCNADFALMALSHQVGFLTAQYKQLVFLLSNGEDDGEDEDDCHKDGKIGFTGDSKK